MFRRSYQSAAQDHQRELTIEACKWLFLLLKPKWHLDIKLEVLTRFLAMAIVNNVNNCKLFYLESFLLISGICGFSFFVIKHIPKPKNHRKFSEAHF